MTDTKPIRLNKANVTKALKAAVEKRGRDYVYGDHFPTCVYVADSQPACLIGEVLATSFNIPLDALAGSGSDSTADYLLEILQRRGILTYTQTAENMLVEAQHLQDAHHSWGEALDAALGK